MLSSRLKIALPLSAVTIAAFFVPGLVGQVAFFLFAMAMVCGGIHEIFELSTGHRGVRPLEIATCIYALALFANSWLRSGDCQCIALSSCEFECIAFVIWLLVAILLCFRGAPDRNQMHLMMTAVFAAVMCQMLMYMPKIYFMGEFGRYSLFFLVLVTKLSDVGAYIIGTATAKLPGGNHKLAKLISPKKSYEGLLGGMLFGVVAGWICWKCVGAKLVFSLAGHESLVWSALDVTVLGLSLPVIGLIGDLMESILKRAADVKDSGHLPGLGGVLDILDSLILATPFFYVWFLCRLQ